MLTLYRSASISQHYKQSLFSKRRMSSLNYDAIVIGSGQGGNPLAKALANAGKKTAIIESTHIGGCCVNDGCTPTKTMIASGRVAHLARRSKDYGVNVTREVSVDMEKVRQRRRDIVKQFSSGSEKGLKAAGVDIYMGTAEFTAQKEIKVVLQEGDQNTLGAQQIFINTGERPAVPSISGIQQIVEKHPHRVLDSTSIQELGQVPESLIVIGGGYIGLEFGQLFARLGSQVTIVQRGPRLLPREDTDITEALYEILKQDGLDVLLSTEAVEITTGKEDELILLVRNKNGVERGVHGTHLLYAAGRTPNVESLKLSRAGIATTRKGYIKVNNELETNVKDTFALGDVKGPPAFTHVSYDDFRILRDKLGLGGKDDKIAKRNVESRTGLVAYCAYTDPQMGHVGLHLSEIPEADRKNVQVAKMPMSYVARALETDESRGLMKAIVRKDSGLILGFTCLGIEGGELMSVVQIAMIGQVPYWELENAVFAHPTIAESLNNLWGFLEDA